MMFVQNDGSVTTAATPRWIVTHFPDGQVFEITEKEQPEDEFPIAALHYLPDAGDENDTREAAYVMAASPALADALAAIVAAWDGLDTDFIRQMPRLIKDARWALREAGRAGQAGDV